MWFFSTFTLGLLWSFPSLALAPWQGDQRAIIVLVEWQNTSSEVSVEDVRETFFGMEAGDRSARQFFRENSQGAFDITGTVLDWRQSSTRWEPRRGCRLTPIINAAWGMFGSDIDKSEYDVDGNGKVDNFFVIHSGRIGSDRVGPECTFAQDSRSDHSIVFQAEGIGSVGEAIAIGFYIHEGGHGYYGLPDLYGDHYRGRYGIGMWGMMGLGAWGVRNDLGLDDLFRYPAHFEPLSKIRMGWLEPRIIDTTTRQVEIRPVESSGDIIAVPIGNGRNYYLEYRSARGFSAEHHGHGLLIWENYTIIQADGRDDINNGTPLGRRPLPPIDENFGDDTDPFPGTDNITYFVNRAAGIRFENISQSSDKIILDVVITGDTRPYQQPTIERYSGQERL